MFFGGGGMPFDFDGMGGPPGGGRGPKKNVDTTAYYKLLDIEKTAGPAEIKKAYRKLAIKHHPDKGGDPETFKNITQAYEVLSDPDKRSKYDVGGVDAVSGEGGGDPSDVFDMFFGGGGGGRRGGGGQRRRERTKDVVHNLQVTMEQLYNGAVKKIAVNRDVLDKAAGVKECAECEGRGVKVQVIRMGPMIQQAQSRCNACSGQGKSFRTKKQRDVLEVHVPKGAVDGHKVVFSGKADEHPDADPGDVVFVLKQKAHASFHRKGADLFIEKDITLLEALTGFAIELEHLDGRKFIIKSKEGEVVTPLKFDPLKADSDELEWDVFEDCDSPGNVVAQAETSDVEQCKKVCEKKKFNCFILNGGVATFKQCSRSDCMAVKKAKSGSTLYVIKDPNEAVEGRVCKAVKGEGMPTVKNPFVYGNLMLILNIVFPTSINKKGAELLKKALPPAMHPKVDDTDAEIHFVQDMDPIVSANENKANQSANAAYDEDEDHGHPGMGGQQVQCNQQ